uniref:Uncharacterized protein n=1 Tax=Arundo donax TaxID=35708 RepID=A0A0A9BCK1_ARUDO
MLICSSRLCLYISLGHFEGSWRMMVFLQILKLILVYFDSIRFACGARLLTSHTESM